MGQMHYEWDIREEIKSLERLLLRVVDDKIKTREILRTIEFAKWVLGE